jgi:hypothetical protein
LPCLALPSARFEKLQYQYININIPHSAFKVAQTSN